MTGGNCCSIGVAAFLALLGTGASYAQVVYRVTDLGSLGTVGDQTARRSA